MTDPIKPLREAAETGFALADAGDMMDMVPFILAGIDGLFGQTSQPRVNYGALMMAAGIIYQSDPQRPPWKSLMEFSEAMIKLGASSVEENPGG